MSLMCQPWNLVTVGDKLVPNYQVLERTSGDGWNVTSVNDSPLGVRTLVGGYSSKKFSFCVVTWSQDFAINSHDWNRTKTLMCNFDDDDKVFMTATNERISHSAAEADSKVGSN